MIGALPPVLRIGIPKWVTPAIKWLIDGAIIAAIVLGAWWLHGRAEAKAWNAAFNAGWSKEHAAHLQTVANYRAAAKEAARLDKANVDRVAKEQSAITEKVSHEYENKLADSASRYDRLRAQANGYLSRPDPAGVPASRDATCQAVAGTRCEELPALLKAAQDNTDQLVALLEWVREQSAVDVGNRP